MLKVLLQSRRTLFDVPGGDTIQITKTAQYLNLLGVKADVSTELHPDVSGYDIVHVFNLTRPQEAYPQILNAAERGAKVALSPVFVSFDEADRRSRTGVQAVAARVLGREMTARAKIAARAIMNREWSSETGGILAGGYERAQERLLSHVGVILPNSESELRRVVEAFPQASRIPAVIVPNAVDRILFGDEQSASEPAMRRDIVLCVARIEPLKCQLQLVRAMRTLPWPLVFVGKPAPNHRRYFEAVRAEARSAVSLVGDVPHETLPEYYRRARVHALVSWFETTGLSSLEAAAMGCNVVITDKGDTRDYFGGLAYYCDPESTASIRSAIEQAYRNPVDGELRRRVLREFTWEQAARKTLDGYDRLRQ